MRKTVTETERFWLFDENINKHHHSLFTVTYRRLSARKKKENKKTRYKNEHFEDRQKRTILFGATETMYTIRTLSNARATTSRSFMTR